jgi:N-acetylglucosamine-6-phosphate deacetylase
MQDARTTVLVICDGYHVAPVMVDLLYRTLGDRLVLATDYMAPAGSGYRIEGGVVRAEDGTIAGSALHVDRAVRNLMTYASLPFERAIASATAAPAALLGVERECGTLAAGKRADITIWNDRYEILTTIVGGVPVYGAEYLTASRTTSVG